MKKEIIIIAGDLGAGKTEVGKKLASFLGYRFISMGDLFRAEAERRNISLVELNELAETDQSIDFAIDDEVRRYLAEEEQYIIDSRMAAFFVPAGIQAFKVHLSVDEDEGARRIWADIQKNPKRKSETGFESVEDVKASNRRRRASEKKRYYALYDIDYDDLSPYDLKRDTTSIQPHEIVNEVQVEYILWRPKLKSVIE